MARTIRAERTVPIDIIFHEGKIKIKLSEEAEKSFLEHDKTTLSEEVL